MEKKLQYGLPRSVEIAMAVFGLALATPILAISAILIRLGSSGPVLFRQDRVGLGGKEFKILKLRTMVTNRKGILVTAANDCRVTSIGRLLRKSKIDELPELWNVLRGDMSFVGPRPEVPQFVDLNDHAWQTILKHRPGLTDPVTLRLRNEEHLLSKVVNKEKYYREVLQPYKLQGYVRFVNDKSWKTDIRIIGRTLLAIAFPRTVEPPSGEEMRLSFGTHGGSLE